MTSAAGVKVMTRNIGSADKTSREAHWDSRHAAVAMHVQETGRLPRRQGAEKVLEQWLQNQRNAYRAGTLYPDRVEKLRSIPGALPEKHRDSFDSRLDQLRAYIEKYGHLPPTAADSTAGDELIDFCKYMRYRAPFRERAEAFDRYRRYTEMTAGVPEKAEIRWLQNLLAAEAYCRQNGCLPIRSRNRNLCLWLDRQSSALANGSLRRFSSAHIGRLRAVLDYPTHFDFLWSRWFYRVVEVVKNSGTLPRQCPLQRWVSRQRQAQRQGLLSGPRTAALYGLPGFLDSSSPEENARLLQNLDTHLASLDLRSLQAGERTGAHRTHGSHD